MTPRRFLFFAGSHTIEVMRYLGIDYGARRIGVAVSNPEGSIALPRTTINAGSEADAVRGVKKIIREEKIKMVVIGLPSAADGTDTEQTRITRMFIKKLATETTIPIKTEDELLTSRMARASGAEGGHIDAASAALILQSFLDRMNAK
ncbi:MAG: Holliday junction resolvase RuvX [bacterium]|nr:Holliday junction resolvase RuvX [bacterium]MDZ4299704.1 Holliday junction resolvase RuvX [Candidatus Sungbacteria bacterium]